MAWAISILQRRRQRQVSIRTHARICRWNQNELLVLTLWKSIEQEAAALATQFALVLQSGQPRTVHFTVSPGPPSSSMAHASTSQHDDDPV